MKRSEKNILMHGLLIEKSSNWFIGHLIFCGGYKHNKQSQEKVD